MLLLTMFFVVFSISALGSLPANMLSLPILQKSINYGKSAARWMALGTFLPQVFYTAIAVEGFDYFNGPTQVGSYIEGVTIIIFLGMAWYFYKKEEKVEDHPPTRLRIENPFTQGFFLGMLNVVVILFWIAVLWWLQPYEIIQKGLVSTAIVAVASATGALASFLVYAELGEFLESRVEHMSRIMNQIIAAVLLVLAVVQVLNLIW